MKEGEDEGGTLALQMGEDLSNKNWADIMQEEQVSLFICYFEKYSESSIWLLH